VLNLNIPEAFDYLVERMSWLLGEHAVDYEVGHEPRAGAAGHNGKAAADANPPVLPSAGCWASASRILNLNPALRGGAH
jgi:hypothetical protein